MNFPNIKKLPAILLVIVLAAAGIYWFQASGRKAADSVPAVAASAGISRDLATGAMAAFLVKKERKPVPDFAFQDGAGKPLTIGQWKGRVALVNLWATWCAPCRKEMPALAKLQAEMGSKDFEVVAISVDLKGAEASSAFLKETGAETLKLYVEPSGEILNQLQALGLPATLLIDRNGREIGRMLGPADWASPDAKTLIQTALAETP